MKSYLLSVFKLERSILVYIISWSVIGLAHLGIVSVLLNLYLLQLGFDFTFLGIMNGSSQIIWALFSLPAGLIGSRFGLRNSLVAAYVTVVIGLVILLSATWLPHEMWGAALLIGNGLVGVAAALVSVNGPPYLMAISPENDRNKAFTLQTSLFTFAAFLGSLVAGTMPGFLMKWFPDLLDTAGAYHIVMWLAVPAYLLTVFFIRTARPEPKTDLVVATRVREAAPIAVFLFLGIFFSLQIGSENSVNMLINVYFVDSLRQSPVMVGTIFAAARLLPFLISPIQPLVLNRWGSGRTLAGGYVVVALCIAAIALLPTATSGVILYIFFSMIISLTGTARTIFAQEAVQSQWRTTSSAVLSISTAAAGGLIGFGSGTILKSSGFRGMYLGGALLALLAVLIYPAYMRFRSRPSAPVFNLDESIIQSED
jgi:DHA1 family multidrug resistance protein-like MFS transporter